MKTLGNPFKILVMAFLLTTVPGTTSATERLTSVLIFPLRVSGVSLSNSQNVEIRNYLGTRLTIEGVYMAMPESQIKKDLGEAKLESYRECYEDVCRIELGAALFADKSLSVDVVAERKRCRVTASIYNIKQEVPESAADVVTGCTYEDIKMVMVAVAAQLSGKSPEAGQSILALQAGNGTSDSQLTRSGGITGITETGTVKAGMTVDLGDKIVNQMTDQTGFLTVKTHVTGETVDAKAMIMLNGKDFRTSDFTADMMIGEYVIAARLDDYHHTATQKINLGTDGKTVELELRPTFGSLVIEADQIDVEILINGGVVGRTASGKVWSDNRRKAGSYVVEVRKGLYKTSKRNVTVNEATETIEKFVLDPDFGNLKVTSKPSGASVSVDGRNAGNTPLTLNNLPSGSHSARVSVDYYIPESVQIMLGEGKTVTKHFDLRSDFGGIKLTSNPAGAAITIDNTLTGKVTPTFFSPVRPGVHVIALELEGYGKSVQTVNVENGVDTAVSAKLEPKLGMLSVIVQKEDGSPCDGEVTVDGKVVGRSPWKGQVLAISHQIVGKCPEGIGAKTVSVRHNGNESVVLEVGDRGYISVRTIAADGKECIGDVTVNNKVVGTTPWADWLKAGPYQIAGTCVEQTGSQSVVLVRGDHKSLNLNLKDKKVRNKTKGNDFKPSVLIFPIRVSGLNLSSSANENLVQYLGVRLTAEGVYQVMPEAQIQKDLGKAKIESYKDCYAESCRIELGRAVMADKNLSVDITSEKGSCRITATIYDLRREMSEAAGDTKAGCRLDDLRVGMKVIAEQLSGTVTGDIAVDLGETIFNKVTDQMGFLTVKTHRKGETGDARAMILLNGKEFRPSPYTTELMVGDYVVAARVDDYYHVATMRINLDKKGATVDLELLPTFGSLTITTEPFDSEVLINDRVVNKAADSRPYMDNKVKSGAYQVDVRRSLYKPIKRLVTVADGKNTSEAFKLEPDWGNIDVTSQPAGATVFLDGKEVGRTFDEKRPLRLVALPTGVHSLRVVKANYLPEDKKIKVGDGLTVMETFILKTAFGD